jgi:hypothetical protein
MSTPPKVRKDLRRVPTDPGELAKFPKQRCKNCPKFFPKTRRNRAFCSAQCKKEFHEHGSAFGPLKDRLTKLIEQHSKEEAANQFAHYVASEDFRRQLAAAGFIHRSQLKKRTPANTPEALRGSLDMTARQVRELEARLLSIEKQIAPPPGFN